ncbi:N-acetylglucosamine-6-phosphate deacetylase [Pelagibius sp.]|uniref:N-acetylglucosamine-6-phosphate deacetylase n=1 Tax=Pelagibius sp. TaxID=1931238 RepID=UPI00260986C9|nr:N-acetylglucosamine-6-phosphate deacetylase [Pelagibius sp.]
MRQILVNGRVFDGETILDGQAVVLDGAIVAAVLPASDAPHDAERVDLQGGLLAPGFIDVQVNGGGGVLFNDTPTVEGIRAIAEAHRRFGTTGLLPTLISDQWPVMTQAAEAVAAALAEGVPGVRGVHFEGPYLNVERKGVHNAQVIRAVDPEALALFASGRLGQVVVTLAPERVAPAFIEDLVAAGVKVCAGHTAATYEQVRRGLEAGITGFTHLFNAMSPLTSREPGVVGAALEDTDSWCGLIADGHHVHDAALKVAIAAKAPGRMMLVTDAMPSVGAAIKRFELGGQEIVVADGRCATPEGRLAGSDLDMAGAVRHSIRHLGLPPAEALRMAALYPAAFLGLEGRLGRIAADFDADLVLLDDDLQVRETWIGGNANSRR